jgi:hypothetical protein
MMTPTIKPAKSQYSEAEAAIALGVSIDDLRALIRRHLLKPDEDPSTVASATFQPSDLLVLRMVLSGMRPLERTDPSSQDPVQSAFL